MNQNPSSSQAPQQNASPFPAPPEYVQNYSNENIRTYQAPKPPKIPSRFTVFNEEYNLEGPMMPSLGDLEIQQFYNSKESWKTELKKLNFSVVASFLDLLEILIKNPQHSDRKEKIETLRTLFINMHHIINESRPIQGRETLVEMMRKQNKDLKSFIEKIKVFNMTIRKNLVKINEDIRNAPLDLSCPPAPAAYMEPPEHKFITYNVSLNKRMTAGELKTHEFKCRTQTLTRHLQLMRVAEGEEEVYTEEFNDADLVDEDQFNQDLEEQEKESVAEEENPEFIQEGESSESSEEEEVESPVMDVAVEYMDDDEDDDDEDSDDMADVNDDAEPEMMKSSDEEESRSSAEDNGVEPPTQFVDDEVKPASNDQPNPDPDIMMNREGFPETPEIPAEMDEQNSRSDSE